MAITDKEIQRVSFPSTIDYLDKVEAITVKVANGLQFNESDVDDLCISITEMFNNAIHHGNKNDRNKKVDLIFRTNKTHLIVSIKDRGAGFEPEQIKDPLAPENLLSENGRGIYLVRNLMDDLQFNITEQGTEVLLFKHLPKQ